MMNIFGTIMAKVSGKAPASTAGPVPAAQSSRTTSAAASALAPGSSAPPGPVDVAAALDVLCHKRSEKLGEKLDWRDSTVDLMKVLSVDSSLLARQELAKELHYDGDSSARDSWLHEQIMAILAATGGKLPIALRQKWYLSHYGP
jgi:Domain of unknown function (DUF3597)